LTKKDPSVTFLNIPEIFGGYVKPRLLVIDSSPAVQRLVEQASGPEGYEVVGFKDGATALDAAKGLNPEIVIADYNLQEMTFPDFCEGLHRLDVLPDTPIISLVSPSDRVDEKHLQSLGVKAFLKKPLQADDLLVIVKKLRQESTRATSSGASSATGRGAGDRNHSASPMGARQETGAGSEEHAGSAASAQLLKSVMDQAHQAVLQMLPDLVAREVRTQADRLLRAELPAKIHEALATEQTTRTIQETVQRGLQDVVREQLEPIVQKQLPDVIKQQSGSLDKAIKEVAETAALQHAHLAAEKIVQEIAQDMVKDVAREVVRDIAPDIAETEIRKEIDRLTASG
jgi:DNA-binding response OmpR family regulator